MLLASKSIFNPLVYSMPLGFTPAAGISRFRRKNGLYSFKLGKKNMHKNPHAMGLKAKESLKKKGYQGQLKINERIRLSDRPFGRSNTKGKFLFDMSKVPFYNVPDLTGFKLKPYVPHITPQVPSEKKERRVVEIDEALLESINQQIHEASSGRLEARGQEGMSKS